jgi:hypothetical protein
MREVAMTLIAQVCDYKEFQFLVVDRDPGGGADLFKEGNRKRSHLSFGFKVLVDPSENLTLPLR